MSEVDKAVAVAKKWRDKAVAEGYGKVTFPYVGRDGQNTPCIPGWISLADDLDIVLQIETIVSALYSLPTATTRQLHERQHYLYTGIAKFRKLLKFLAAEKVVVLDKIGGTYWWRLSQRTLEEEAVITDFLMTRLGGTPKDFRVFRWWTKIHYDFLHRHPDRPADLPALAFLAQMLSIDPKFVANQNSYWLRVPVRLFFGEDA